MPEKTVDHVLLSESPLNASQSFRANDNYYYDSSGTGNHFRNGVQQIEEHRRLRYTKFPSLKGIHGCSQKHSSENKTKTVRWNDEETSGLKAPHRAYDSLIDPTSGFVSAGGLIEGNAGHGRIESMVQLNKTPQSVTPRAETSRHKKLLSAGDLDRLNHWSPGAPTAWNSRKTLDIWIRSKLGGWTSDVDPRKAKDKGPRSQSSLVKGQTQSIQDQLALKYIYGNSTQRGYEDVPWDRILRPKQWPSTVTVYDKPDTVLYQRNAKHTRPAIEHLQVTNAHTSGMSSRPPLYQDGSVNSASLEHQLKQSPLYSEHAQVENFKQADRGVFRCGTPDANNVRTSSTVQQCDTAQSDPLEKTSGDHRRKSRMSKMVTLVSPHNPFNSLEKHMLHV